MLLDAHAACKQHAHAASRQARAWPGARCLRSHVTCPRGLLLDVHAACWNMPMPSAREACTQMSTLLATRCTRDLLVQAHAAGWLPNVHAAWGCLPARHTAICPRGLRLDAHAACRQHAPAVGSQVCARRASRSLLLQVRAACRQMCTLSCHVSARLASRYPRGLLEHAHAK